MMEQSPTRAGSASPGARGIAPLALLAIFMILFLPVLLSGAEGTSEAYDAREYHLPVIRRFVQQWPRLDLVNYESATAPGYHLFMASLLKLAGSETLLRAANACFGVGLVLAIYLACRRAAASPWTAAALALPIACSPYTLGATIWLTTDNAAMLFVVLALGGVLFGPYSSAKNLRLGLYALLATGVRQIHVWLAAPVALVGLLAASLPAAFIKLLPRWVSEDPWLDRGCRGSWLHPIAGAISAAMPVGVLIWFVSMWGGLMPKATGYVELHNQGPNFAAPAFCLALVGTLGVFFLPFAWHRVAALIRKPADLVAVACAAGALLVALAPATSHLWKPRSYGWLWKIVEKAPDLGERSLVITALAPVGALVLLLMHRAACDAGRRLPSLILLASLLGWLLAQTMNTMAWQRYFEPMVVVALALMAAMTAHAPTRRPEQPMPAPRSEGRGIFARAGAALGPVALAGVYVLLNAVTTYREVLADLGKPVQ